MTPRASRIADIVASVPEETKRTCSTGVRATISSAASLGTPSAPTDDSAVSVTYPARQRAVSQFGLLPVAERTLEVTLAGVLMQQFNPGPDDPSVTELSEFRDTMTDLAQRGQLDEAIVLLRRATELAPHGAGAYHNLASAYRDRGMAAYSELQQAEFASEAAGYTATRHQREVGTGYFDAIATAISAGQASTTALGESTEAAQFAHA